MGYKVVVSIGVLFTAIQCSALSNTINILEKDTQDLKKSFRGLYWDIKNNIYSVQELYHLIEIFKVGSENNYYQAKNLQKQKTVKSLNKSLKLQKIKKHAYKVNKKAKKLLDAEIPLTIY